MSRNPSAKFNSFTFRQLNAHTRPQSKHTAWRRNVDGESCSVLRYTYASTAAVMIQHVTCMPHSLFSHRIVSASKFAPLFRRRKLLRFVYVFFFFFSCTLTSWKILDASSVCVIRFGFEFFCAYESRAFRDSQSHWNMPVNNSISSTWTRGCAIACRWSCFARSAKVWMNTH